MAFDPAQYLQQQKETHPPNTPQVKEEPVIQIQGGVTETDTTIPEEGTVISVSKGLHQNDLPQTPTKPVDSTQIAQTLDDATFLKEMRRRGMSQQPNTTSHTKPDTPETITPKTPQQQTQQTIQQTTQQQPQQTTQQQNQRKQKRIAWLKELKTPKTGTPVIGITSIKGGSGKTSVALTLASIFAKVQKRSVCIIDVDPTGNAANRSPETQTHDIQDFVESLKTTPHINTKDFTVETTFGVNILGSRTNITKKPVKAEDVPKVVTQVAKDFDVVILDMLHFYDSAYYAVLLNQLDVVVSVFEMKAQAVSTVKQFDDVLTHMGSARLKDSWVVVFNEARSTGEDDGFVEVARPVAKDLVARGVEVSRVPYALSLAFGSALPDGVLGFPEFEEMVRLGAAVWSKVPDGCRRD